VGRDAADNIGIGGAIKVVEDVSASFTNTTAGEDGLVSTGGEDSVVIKLKNWPLADHDGDGSLQDSITAITVGGTTPHNMQYVDGNAATGAARGGFRWPAGVNTVTSAGNSNADDNTTGAVVTYGPFTSSSTGITNSNALCTGWSITAGVANAQATTRTITVVNPGDGTGCAANDTITIAKAQLGDAHGNGADAVVTIGAVNGAVANSSTPLATDAISAWLSSVNWSDAGETVTLTASANAKVNIVEGSTVKVTYYYVDPAQVVELDLDAPTVTFSPTNLTSLTDKTPSISFAWDDDEYAGDNYTTVEMTKATLKDPDGVTTDILADVTTTDSKTFYYRPSEDFANGDYSLTVSAKDSAGNEKKDQTSKFTIKDRTKTTIAMEPGWNLISLPGDPSDTAINTVIDNSQVETVLTYDPSTPGGWLTAVRDGDALVGTLTEMSASHGYWIFQKNGDDIKVDLPGYKGGASSVPPVISVVEGWNLVPAVTLTTGQTTPDASWDADSYFAGVDWARAKGWNATAETWIDVLPDLTKLDANLSDDTNIVAGKGYWLYANAAGVIVP
jgi:hypothetical protein